MVAPKGKEFSMTDNERRIRIGQRFITGFPEDHVTDEFRSMVKKWKIGNIILFQHNIKSRAQLKALTKELEDLVVSETGIKPFIAIDQEGGVVTRLPSDAINVPGAMALSSLRENCEEAIFRCASITAKEMLSLGCTLDFAPDCDVNNNPQNRVIGVRSYSGDPYVVAKNSSFAIKGYLSQGLVCCAKHFPGHGDTSVDSHIGLPVIEKSLEELEEVELVPFRASIEAGVPSIMTSHIVFPKIDDSGLPSTMNRTIITGILRERLGYDGLDFTDCLEMGAIKQNWGTVNGAIMAFKAGVDIACISHTPSLACEACDIAFESVDDAELNESFMRIVLAKDRFLSRRIPQYNVVEREFDAAYVERIRARTLTEVHKLNPLGSFPAFVGCYPFVVTLASNPENKTACFPLAMKELFEGRTIGATAIVTSVDPTAEEIKEVCEKCHSNTSVTIGTYNGHSKPGQIALIKALEKTMSCVNVVALRNPFEFSELSPSTGALAAYEYSPMIMAPIAAVLSGNACADGITRLGGVHE